MMSDDKIVNIALIIIFIVLIIGFGFIFIIANNASNYHDQQCKDLGYNYLYCEHIGCYCVGNSSSIEVIINWQTEKVIPVRNK